MSPGGHERTLCAVWNRAFPETKSEQLTAAAGVHLCGPGLRLTTGWNFCPASWVIKIATGREGRRLRKARHCVVTSERILETSAKQVQRAPVFVGVGYRCFSAASTWSRVSI